MSAELFVIVERAGEEESDMPFESLSFVAATKDIAKGLGSFDDGVPESAVVLFGDPDEAEGWLSDIDWERILQVHTLEVEVPAGAYIPQNPRAASATLGFLNPQDAAKYLVTLPGADGYEVIALSLN